MCESEKGLCLHLLINICPSAFMKSYIFKVPASFREPDRDAHVRRYRNLHRRLVRLCFNTVLTVSDCLAKIDMQARTVYRIAIGISGLFLLSSLELPAITL